MNWINTTVGEYCPFIYGKALPKRIRKKGSIPVYGSNGIVDYHSESCVSTPGVVIGRKGTIGSVHLSTTEFWPIDTSFYLQKDNFDELIFTYYLLTTLGLENKNTDTAIPGLNREVAHSISIRIPELSKDRANLGRWLYLLDKKIEINNQINETLESMAQAIFKSWFVDFDPVRVKAEAKADGKDNAGILRAAMAVIASESEQALTQMAQDSPEEYKKLEATAKAFPDAFVESELGLIPEGWEVKPLSDLIIITGGGTPKRSEPSFWNGEIPWFSIKDISSGSLFVIDTIEKITLLGLKKSSTKLLKEGTTIITARGTVGKLALLAMDCCMNQSCYGITGKETGKYFNYFNLNEAINTLQQNVHGAVFDTITTKTFDTYVLAYSGTALANIYEENITPALEMIKNNMYQNKTLTELRDSLLPKLLSGEIEV